MYCTCIFCSTKQELFQHVFGGIAGGVLVDEAVDETDDLVVGEEIEEAVAPQHHETVLLRDSMGAHARSYAKVGRAEKVPNSQNTH